MDGAGKPFRYRLGIDVGVASLGIAILAFTKENNPDTDEPDYQITGGSVRTYPIPEGASERREKRGMRRNIERRERRLDRLSDLLAAHGIGAPRKQTAKHILDLSPIKMRAMASRGRVKLAHLSRALLHLARHRGSSAFREADIKDDKEARQTAEGIKNLRHEMAAKGLKTYGQYLRWREKRNLPIRINQEKMANSKDGYAFYPSREMLHEEFGAIWDLQATFYPEVLTDALKQEVAAELFFQRAVTSPPPGKCPYFPEEYRLPRTSRLFQIRRIYEETNHLRFSGKSGLSISYDLADRDKIVARLMAGEDLTFAEIKKTLGLQRTDKVSIEDAQTRKGIDGYPFDRALGAPEALGGVWLQAGAGTQDEILDVLATEHDDAKAEDRLSKILGGDGAAAKRALQAPLPSGWGHMGLTATRKILEELKKDLVPARIAEDRAGLVHTMTPDGVFYDRLPYYGEILVGHTVKPMWVSSYRRATDLPPHTDPDEAKYGRIPNPIVHLALNQIRRTVNAVVAKYGLPESIHIELARQLNKSADARAEIEVQNAKNREASDNAAKELENIHVTVNRLNIQKYKLWQEQGGECVYTGAPISLSQLYFGDIDVDHILPRSKTYSDSLANKLVCVRAANAAKRNRPPYLAFADYGEYDWDAIMRRAEKLPDNKKWRFESDAMKRFEEDPEAYRARYGTDNSYIARVARQYLACLYGEQHKVVAVSSYIVSLLRGKWGLHKILGGGRGGGKSRLDHRHHFVDALVAACATRGMIGRIQREAARCEREQLDAFVETIDPPFGAAKAFFNAAREATLERVTLSRKADHSTAGQLHEDTLMGIIDGPDKAGAYVCRKRKKLKDYNTLENFEKPKIPTSMPDLPEIMQARDDLEAIKDSVRDKVYLATQELEDEREADIAAGKKRKNISDLAVYSRAVDMHEKAGGKTVFTLYEMNKLVNVRRADGANRPYGGYISGRNHHKDFYLDEKGKVCWQLVTMIDANDRNFVPQANRLGNKLLWSAHKEDTLLIDDPEDPGRRIRVVVAKFTNVKMGVVPEADARDSKERVMWEFGLKFFRDHGAQLVVTDPLGDITWRFPALQGAAPREPES